MTSCNRVFSFYKKSHIHKITLKDLMELNLNNYIFVSLAQDTMTRPLIE